MNDIVKKIIYINMQFKNWIMSEGKGTYVYHASPEAGLYIMRPRGRKKGLQVRKQGQAGIYVAPNFSTAVKWATSFVTWKKGKMKPPRGSDYGPHHGKPLYYQNITIYKIKAPKNLIDNAWSASWWEKEHFIPEEFIPNLEIVSSKTFSIQDLFRLERREAQIKNEKVPGWDAARAAPLVKQTNIAAREWLQLKDVYANKLLRKKIGYMDKDKINGLLHRLERFFIADWDRKPQKKLSPEKEAQAIAVIEQIKNLINKHPG